MMNKYKDIRSISMWRPSSTIRIIKHSIQYTIMYSLIPISSYLFAVTKPVSIGMVMKNSMKQLFSKSVVGLCFFSIHELMFKKYKQSYFTIRNLLSTASVVPLLYVLQNKSIVKGCRTALILCIFSIIRDFDIQFRRFTLLKKKQQPQRQKQIEKQQTI